MEICGMDRLPAVPLIVNDPYFSVWMRDDKLTGMVPTHWYGQDKELFGHFVVDGRKTCYLGKQYMPYAETTALRVTPTRTISVYRESGVELKVTFTTPALPDDFDTLSVPVTFVDFDVRALDHKKHSVKITFHASIDLCCDGDTQAPMMCGRYQMHGMNISYMGQRKQKILGESGDHVTIDWGYLYMASPYTVTVDEKLGEDFVFECEAEEETVHSYLLLGYDDIASVNYFGNLCRAYYTRNGANITDALKNFNDRHDELTEKCEKLDEDVMAEARRIGGENYELIAAASWRQVFGAHKLIVTPEGKAAFLSKENDSNGCMATVDVSYPSIPLFLRFAPELVNALCRPILKFAAMPVWTFDFAPHDVGRYPYATGQMYASLRREEFANGEVHPPYYLYPDGRDIYNPARQMPVEECGNMLIMLETAMTFGAGEELAKKYMPVLDQWAQYLILNGEDPGEQLCTDDFAGHMSRNINLAAKAMVGVACYGRLLCRFGREEEGKKMKALSHKMAKSWQERAVTKDATALTFEGNGWSMKYNLVWDLVLNLHLLDKSFYERETKSYLSKINEFGLPMDSRADYTKSDWTVWCASMAQDQKTFDALIAPVAHFLRTTQSRVPFSDWYDTKTGKYMEFIARSVQGGLYMPFLLKKDVKEKNNENC